MKETVFNIFLFINNRIISEIGVISYELIGIDEDKLNFLKERAKSDFDHAKKFKIPSVFKLKIKEEEYNALTYDRYREMVHTGTDGTLFKEIYEYYNASITPLICITNIVDGEILIDGFEKVKPEVNHLKNVSEILIPDYVMEYFTETEFRFTDLINDDFFKGIRLTFQNKLYVSSIKLMMSFIDTAAYLEYGDINGNFKKWLDTYAELSNINILSNELWEFRNSILHMTNLNSRKINEGKVKRLQFYVSNENIPLLKISDSFKYFNYRELITIIAKGVENWGQTYYTDKNKIDSFIIRYDSIVSDQSIPPLYHVL